MYTWTNYAHHQKLQPTSLSDLQWNILGTHFIANTYQYKTSIKIVICPNFFNITSFKIQLWALSHCISMPAFCSISAMKLFVLLPLHILF